MNSLYFSLPPLCGTQPMTMRRGKMNNFLFVLFWQKDKQLFNINYMIKFKLKCQLNAWKWVWLQLNHWHFVGFHLSKETPFNMKWFFECQCHKLVFNGNKKLWTMKQSGTSHCECDTLASVFRSMRWEIIMMLAMMLPFSLDVSFFLFCVLEHSPTNFNQPFQQFPAQMSCTFSASFCTLKP